MGDIDLLQEYTTRNSEEAFAAIVARHINLVYSVALRHAGNPHQAQEITQAVFIVLARKARSLRSGTVLSGWLFHAARMTASNFLRTEMRRARREQEAYMRSTMGDADSGNDWQQVAPMLDAAIADLGEKDRNAVVLRYVEGKDLKEVGLALGASEDAAKKRVSRAVEKLRGYFSKRGVVLSGAAVAAAISANAMQAAPAGLAAAIAANALNTTVATTSTLTLVKGTLKLMAWTKVKIATGVAVAALVAYQWHVNANQSDQLTQLRSQLEDARQQAVQEQATIDKLNQQKLAMVEEKREAQKASANLLAHQRAAFDASKAKLSAEAAAGKSNSPGGALSKLLDDPSMKAMIREQQLKTLKDQYAPFIKQLNLSPDAADKFMQLLADDAAAKMDLGMSVMKGDVDRATLKQSMADAKNDLDGQLLTLLGTDGFAQYQNYSQEVPARTMLGLIKAQMGDNPLSSDQSTQLLQLMKAGPQPNENDSFDQTATEQYLQKEEANNQTILQQAAGFLSPEQLASLGAFQTNMLNMQKMGMNMQAKFFLGGK